MLITYNKEKIIDATFNKEEIIDALRMHVFSETGWHIPPNLITDLDAHEDGEPLDGNLNSITLTVASSEGKINE